MDEFELLNWPWDWVPSYVVLWWADDLPWCSQSLLKAAWIGSSSGRWMDGSHYFQESHKDMKMHLFDAMLYFTPLWGEPCLTNDTCVKVLIDVNTFLMSQSKMQNSRHFKCYSTAEGINWKSHVSDKERDLVEWNWCQKGIRGKPSCINFPGHL